MTAKERARAIDYYFIYDFRARRANFIITVGIGTASLFLCRLFSLPEAPSLLWSSLLILVTFIGYLVKYHSPEGISLQGELKERTLAKLWESNQLDLGRRHSILKVPAFATALLCLAFVPKLTLAQVVNERIRRLIRASRDSDAKAEAESAIHADVALYPDVVKVIASPGVFDKNGRITPLHPWLGSDSAAPRDRHVTVELESGEKIAIWLPVISAGTGRYRFESTINEGWISVLGEGQDKSYLLIENEGKSGFPALFNFPSKMLADVLIYGLTALPASLAPRSDTSFLSVTVGSSKVAVSNVSVQFLHQTLDRVIWNDVSFEGCAITCGGDWFRLTNVEFLNCQFDFAEGFPANLRERFEGDQKQRMSMYYNP